MKRNAWIGVGVAVVLAGGGAAYFLHGSKDEVKWKTAKVDKGHITARISATGTLNALIQVPVGTQVSGVVTGLFADFNSLVKKNQVIGKIDETPWITQLHNAEAVLTNAKSALVFAQADYKRNKRLWEEKLVDDADLDAKNLALRTAEGNLEEAKAGLETARTNLGYCTIKAPVDGVVVARLVDVGQTVAASFSTPSVFSIAQNLSKMKVQAAIDEADIGQVKVGQKAFFTVDSYPDKQFRGIVSEVQLNPVINQNVVTYNVIMEVDNEARYALAQGAQGGRGGREGRGGPGAAGVAPASFHPGGATPGEGRQGGWRGGEGHPGQSAGAKAPEAGKAGAIVKNQPADIELTTARYIPPGSPIYKGELALFPGMTANCTIVTKEVDQAVRVPSSALRFNPALFMKDLEVKPAQGAARASASGPGGGGGTGRGLVAKREDRVWILVNGKPKLLPVRAGATDGMFTEISGEGVAEGMVVLTGVENMGKVNISAAPLGGPGGMRR